ncbi:MAG: ferrous iron transport protein B [Endomicrobium sp.]|jgi:ferrous iron transport protein B|nr:ferrous iron transport protein B [Endomicrobium sp.]
MNTVDKYITVVLVGNPNCGKSTIFNILTGSKQRIGNYPGVTIEKKEGFKNYEGYNISFIDLPGIYSLSAYSDEEIVARDFLLNRNVDIIVNVIDASNIERNLYLFTQITELNIPIIISLNMIDVLLSQGKTIDEKMMSKLLGVPLFNTIANKGIGVHSVLNLILDVHKNKCKKQSNTKINYGEIIKNETYKLENIIMKNPKLLKFPKSWLALKLLENEPSILGLILQVSNCSNIMYNVKMGRNYIEKYFGEKAEIIIISKRYSFVSNIVKIVIKKTDQNKIDMTDIIDKFVLNRYFGLPIFALVMYVIFKFTFTFSIPVINLFNLFFEWLKKITIVTIPDGILQSMIVDGIIGGIGGVLVFFPLILFMFFVIAFFEDSGYMARAVYIMDKIMNKFGLHGKSFLPLIISINGCAVPGILATRTLDFKRDRLITMFIVPFMICGAKLPVFALIIGVFFPVKYQAIIMFSVYVLSIIIALSVAKILNMTIIKGQETHFIMELPPYHIPAFKVLFLKMWEKGWLYVKKTAGVVVAVSILIWVLFAYPKILASKSLKTSENTSTKFSIAKQFVKVIDPLFKPIGMDGSKATALIAGFAAKELIISTLGTIYSIEKNNTNAINSQSLKSKLELDKNWSPLKGITFLIFCLIYVPCIATVIVFFKETGSNYKWLTMLIVGNTSLAWIASFIVFQLGKFFKIGI